MRFLVAWIVPTWIVFELVTTKLPHYVLPLYPAIAILIARHRAPHALEQSASHVLHRDVADLRGGVPAVTIIGLIDMRGQFDCLAWPFAAGAAIFALRWRLDDIEGAERRSCARASARSHADRGVGAAPPLMRRSSEPGACRNGGRERTP